MVVREYEENIKNYKLASSKKCANKHLCSELQWVFHEDYLLQWQFSAAYMWKKHCIVLIKQKRLENFKSKWKFIDRGELFEFVFSSFKLQWGLLREVFSMKWERSYFYPSSKRWGLYWEGWRRCLLELI